jgi:hypothetical protein
MCVQSSNNEKKEMKGPWQAEYTDLVNNVESMVKVRFRAIRKRTKMPVSK